MRKTDCRRRRRRGSGGSSGWSGLGHAGCQASPSTAETLCERRSNPDGRPARSGRSVNPQESPQRHAVRRLWLDQAPVACGVAGRVSSAGNPDRKPVACAGLGPDGALNSFSTTMGQAGEKAAAKAHAAALMLMRADEPRAPPSHQRTPPCTAHSRHSPLRSRPAPLPPGSARSLARRSRPASGEAAPLAEAAPSPRPRAALSDLSSFRMATSLAQLSRCGLRPLPTRGLLSARSHAAPTARVARLVTCQAAKDSVRTR